MDFFINYSLSTILWILAIAASIIACTKLNEAKARAVALTASLLVLGISLLQYFAIFDPNQSQLQLVETYDWIANIKFSLGVDGLSYSMILLLSILLPCVIMASKPIASQQKPRLYYSLILILSFAVMLVFMAKDIFVFFLAWELELLPMYFLICIWGSKNRNYASMKFLLYTFGAGVFLLLGLFVLLSQIDFQTFDMIELGKAAQGLDPQIQLLIFLLVGLCFIIKLPSVPLHTWLPDAHVEAPTPVSMLLAGILLKMGSYGLIRFGINFFPNIVIELAPSLAILGAVNIIYAAYVALIQTDIKKIIAYSSVSHMGFVLLGMASINSVGYSGAIFQMFSHGLISAALFMLVGMIYERTHTRDIVELGGGFAKVMPKIFFIFLIAAMANLGLPGLSGFVGESLVFYGVFASDVFDSLPVNPIQISCAFASLGLILTAAYMLWLNQRLFYGNIDSKWLKLKDIRKEEVLILSALLGLSIFYGFFPRLINDLYSTLLNSCFI
jgi:proton-translocating NADH-quinone oxidoreductase chain M